MTLPSAPGAKPAAAPAPVPGAVSAGAPAAAGDPAFKEIADRLGAMTKAIEAEKSAIKGFESKMGQMEERMRFLQNISEVISMNYNPFLGSEEGEFFEGLKPQLRGGNGKDGPGSASSLPSPASPAPPGDGNAVPLAGPPSVAPSATGATPEGAVVRADGREIVPVASAPPPGSRDGAAAAGRFPSGFGSAPGAAADVGAPSPAPLPPASHAGAGAAAAIGVPADAVPPLVRPGSEGAWRSPGRGPGDLAARLGTNASYVAMAWFDFLLQQVPAARIHELLDYYREVGWISAEAHAWLDELASGIAPRPRAPKGKRGARRHAAPAVPLVPSPQELVRIHRTSLRFLDYLFGHRLQEGEVVQLDHAMRRLIEMR